MVVLFIHDVFLGGGKGGWYVWKWNTKQDEVDSNMSIIDISDDDDDTHKNMLVLDLQNSIEFVIYKKITPFNIMIKIHDRTNYWRSSGNWLLSGNPNKVILNKSIRVKVIVKRYSRLERGSQPVTLQISRICMILFPISSSLSSNNSFPFMDVFPNI